MARDVEVYLQRKGSNAEASKMALLQIEHTYYKHDKMALAVHKAFEFNKKWGHYSDLHPAALGKTTATGENAHHPAASNGYPTVVPSDFDPSQYMEALVSVVFVHGDERAKTRALLCSVFHHALHDRYYQARDMFLISHVQDIIEKVDVGTQVLYNRTLVTMGVAAFKLGLIQQAHDSLSSICSGRVKELLAQATSRWNQDKDANQEQERKAERRRQVPYHMHINTDMLECCHLCSAMLLDLPLLARQGANFYPVSKSFRKYMMQHNRQVFTGPPENVRDHIMQAAKAILNGDHSKAIAFIMKLDTWSLLPGDGVEGVKATIKTKIVEMSLRVYLLTTGAHYDSITLAHLMELFQVESEVAKRAVSSMIAKKEISGAWEAGETVLTLYKVSPSSLQTVSKQVAEKINQLADCNERLLFPLSGGAAGYSQKDDAWAGERKGQWQGDGRGRFGGAGRGGGWKGQGGGGGGPGGGMNRFAGGRPQGSRAGGRKDDNKGKSNVWAAGKSGNAYTKRAAGGGAGQGQGQKRY
jgi:translation initiation factor 3 subunit C